MERGRSICLAVLAGALALAGWSARPAGAAPPAVKTTGLPAGWDAQPLGTDDTLRAPQSVSYDNGKWTIQAAGKDLWNEADGGLIIYQKHTGNGSATLRLLSQTGGQDGGWVKTGVAFRETLEPGSRHAEMLYCSGNMFAPNVRVNADETPKHPGNDGSVGVGYNGRGSDTIPPTGRDIGDSIWVGIERDGPTFRMFGSNDGKVWTKYGGTTQTDFAAEMLAGIEATAHDDDDGVVGEVQTSVFDNVSISNDLLTPRSISGIQMLARDKGALIAWNGPAVDGVTFNVYQVDSNLGNPKKLNADPIKGSSYVVEGLENGQPYHFAITAVVDGVESLMQMPEPVAESHGDNAATVVPMAPVLGGLSLVNIGTGDPGSVSVSGDGANAVVTMKAGGWDIWEQSDGFAFLAMPMAGDVDISARFVKGPAEVDGGGGWELGGPMFRESADAGSRFVLAQISRANQLQFKRRRIQYATPTNTGLDRDDNEKRPVSARLVRKGNTFQAYYSEDNGATWKDLGDPSITDPGDSTSSKDTLDNFASTPLVGIALTAHAEGQVTEATIDQIVIKTP
jgi:hypothetical protein